MRRLHRRQALEFLLHLRPLTQAGSINEPDLPVAPCPRHCNAVARDACFRSGDEPVVVENAVDQRRLARIRATDKSDADRLVRFHRRFGVGIERLLVLDDRLKRDIPVCRLKLLLSLPQEFVEIRQSLAMFGRQRRRIAKAKTPGFHQPLIALLALALVGA